MNNQIKMSQKEDTMDPAKNPANRNCEKHLISVFFLWLKRQLGPCTALRGRPTRSTSQTKGPIEFPPVRYQNKEEILPIPGILCTLWEQGPKFLYIIYKTKSPGLLTN